MTSRWCNRPHGRSIRLPAVTEATACQAVENSRVSEMTNFRAKNAYHIPALGQCPV
jgi:hypothetical protein